MITSLLSEHVHKASKKMEVNEKTFEMATATKQLQAV